MDQAFSSVARESGLRDLLGSVQDGLALPVWLEGARLKHAEEYPAVAYQEKAALAQAAFEGQLGVLQWVHNASEGQKGRSSDELVHAAEGGHMHIMEWIHEGGCRMKARPVRICNGDGVLSKTKGLPVLQWLHQNRSDLLPSRLNLFPTQFEVDVEGETANRSLELEVAQWWALVHPSWLASDSSAKELLYFFAKAGDVEGAKWLLGTSLGVQVYWVEQCCRYKGNPNANNMNSPTVVHAFVDCCFVSNPEVRTSVMKWLVELGIFRSINSSAMLELVRRAAEKNQLQGIQMLLGVNT
eukprot:CAMPEP_0113950604 /NCGR_PEP_ID=MMETSP1339-20121228/81652_1 /TAXON_ID=94617 /ORGANISM="Fibrocapsa japonica" /LENGTH=297 /DNA_ID=CAMNT_0000958493 /DNA_START=1 /DNA_END=894 /DNA_ORIENTATION=+ /assembly_acc=CAM_ASM_000762